MSKAEFLSLPKTPNKDLEVSQLPLPSLPSQPSCRYHSFTANDDSYQGTTHTAPYGSTAEAYMMNARKACSFGYSSTRQSNNFSEDSLKTTQQVSISRLPLIGAAKCNRLFWLCTSEPLKDTPTAHYFTTDYLFIYDPYFADFGPLNLGKVYRYCEFIENKLKNTALDGKRLIHCCSTNARLRPNAAFLFCAYQVLVQGASADKAYKPFNKISPPFLPYRDATYGTCSYHITVYECLKALQLAKSLGWFSIDTFDIKNYEKNSRVENGDLNWIIPNKFVAFSAPSSSPNSYGYLTFTPEDYVERFLKMGITLVIRLNKKHYDKRKFTQHGIQHRDLYFIDGSCPSLDIIRKFIEWCEREPGPTAVHCRAGLGRTGTLIGCYAIKNYGFPPNLWIAWNRICRPGSILGPQQSFLTTVQPHLVKMQRIYPFESGKVCEEEEPSIICLPDSNESVVPAGSLGDDSAGNKLISKSGRSTALHGDFGQGERLVQAKHSSLMKRIHDSRSTFSPTLEPSSPASTTPMSISTTASATPYSRSNSHDMPSPKPCSSGNGSAPPGAAENDNAAAPLQSQTTPTSDRATTAQPSSPPARRTHTSSFSFIFASKLFRGYDSSQEGRKGKTAGKHRQDSNKDASLGSKAWSVDAVVSSRHTVPSMRRLIGSACTAKINAGEQSTKDE